MNATVPRSLEYTRPFLIRPSRAGESDFPAKVNAFLTALPEEFRFALLLDRVSSWVNLGAHEAMLETLKDVTGLTDFEEIDDDASHA